MVSVEDSPASARRGGTILTWDSCSRWTTRRAAATSVMEPATRTPASGPASSAMAVAVAIASATVGATVTFSAPHTSVAAAARSATGVARGESVCVTTTWSTTRDSPARIPSPSLSASTATTPTVVEKPNASGRVAASASTPCGLCAASTTIVGWSWITSSRPGDVAPAKPRATASASSAWAAGTRWKISRKASVAASAIIAFWAWKSPWSATSASETAPMVRMRTTWPAGSAARPSTSWCTPSQRITAPALAAAARMMSSATSGCIAETTVAPGLMMPDFSAATPVMPPTK